MIDWLIHFSEDLLKTCRDVAPITAIIIGFQVLVIRKPILHPMKTLLGFVNVLIGITFFMDGLKMALFPLGELMATQLTAPEFLGIPPNTTVADWRNYFWVYLFAGSIGFATTLAEPSLLAVAVKAEEISGGAIRAWGLRIAVSLGVSFGIALGAFRIVNGTELYFFIIGAYVIVIIQTILTPKLIVGLAYDSGGVTTSTVTVPLVTALGIGLATTVPGRNPLLDGFGLIAFASLFAVIAVLTYAQLAEWRNKKQNSSNQSPSK
ncbi:DUF1538 domain-containing protein [Methylotuvimicrobium alcaliphilum]|uniref:DUF1538 domain-containing protein n=1 Tax=Methylotuvimicrobium alcaliphilum (strain DSM 19304 / NCIMB 14124 / VKM B-2133 / 20Z) TaxID=1091494 RepID=G4T1Z6_META2|nr:DUF1538 domain-containing protein [Methylotuvimicrobium alcaliphilum]CCE24670.1 conserved membrane protein of unknown function [Methylotuvimicrobium alcaliphilum 20Z]